MAIGVFFFRMALMSLAALQLNRNLSPFPSPKKESKLSTSGAYKYIHHPIYTGLPLTAIAWATIKESPIHLDRLEDLDQEQLLPGSWKPNGALWSRQAGSLLPEPIDACSNHRQCAA